MNQSLTKTTVKAVSGSVQDMAMAKYGSTSPQAIFRALSGCDVVAIVDISGSMEGRNIRNAKQQLEKLQQQYPGKVAVLAFNTDVYPVWTGNMDEIGVFGGTSYGAIGRHDLLSKCNRMNKTMIIISDGRPNEIGYADYRTNGELDRLVSQFHTPEAMWVNPVHSIYIGTPGSDGEEILRDLTKRLGGTHELKSAANLMLGVEKILALGDGK